MTDSHDPIRERELLLTRRRFFGKAAGGLAGGLGALAMNSLLGRELGARPASMAGMPVDGMSPNVPLIGPHFKPKAKRVIYMHMEGAPSHLDLYDYKPGLRARYNQDLPDSIRNGQRLTGMTSGQARFPIAPSIFKFSRY